MAAKLLHSLADDNPDLQKQIGCMTGIFQIFDRHHSLTGKRITHKRLPPGCSNFSNGSLERQSNNVHYHQTSAEMSLNKSVSEKQRVSTESSRASFSSACSSSASSVDFDRTAQQEVSSYDRVIFPETSSRDSMMNQSNTSPRLGRQSLDLRDVVKDSMYREAKGLAIKMTTKEEVTGHRVKHRDSPRPSQVSKQAEGYNGFGISEKQNTSVDLKESLRVLAKLREAPWYYNDSREQPRSLYESISKDAPRFSYDGREISCLSFESREAIKSAIKLKELPRLSLDSRESTIRSSNFGSKPNNVSRISRSSGISNEKDISVAQSSGAQKRPPSVVAKLMGLDALPDSTTAGDGESGSIKTFHAQDTELATKPLKINNLNRHTRTPNSPRSSIKEPASPLWRNPDLAMKRISSSRFPIEPAPWKVQDGNKSSLRTSSRTAKALPRTHDSLPSVYSEIEKRLKDLEFKQSGKNLRALKQILEAMQAKGLLETGREDQASNVGIRGQNEQGNASPSLSLRSASQRSQQSNLTNASMTRGSGSGRTFDSPIVIMKPAKFVEKSGMSSSVVSADVLSNIYKPHNVGAVDSKKGPNNSQTAKDQSPKYSRRNASISLVDKRGSSKSLKSPNSSSRSQQLPNDNTVTNSAKSSGSVSPRLQQKKLELEKRSRPPTAPSSSSKPRKQTNRQPIDSGSPGGRSRPKYPTNSQQCDDQLSEITNESKSLSCHGDDTSLLSDGNVLFDAKSDLEVTSALRSIELNSSDSLSMKGANNLVADSLQKKAIPRLDEDVSSVELATLPAEHPSPVTVLDTSAFKDDEPSPVKQTTPLKGNLARYLDENHGEDLWNPADNLLSNSAVSGVTTEINRKKLENIENLVQKLRRLNSSHDEARTDYIASLCENTNPDHRYISEILLASGLLLRDLSSGLTMFQLHPSGHPINPELFFVLEQTKASSLQQLTEECSSEKCVGVKSSDMEKLHRKIIFDAVNEVLVGKLALVSVSHEPWLKPEKLARKTLNAQKLLKELCQEIEQFQTKKLDFSLEAEDDSLKAILCEDVMRRSGSWTDFSGQIYGVVLDVERSIFKDLVDEVVRGEATNLPAKPGRRRQLFAK